MKIKVNRFTCIGCGACESTAPEYFQMNEDGISESISTGIDEESDLLRDVIDSCPSNAIKIEVGDE